MSGTIKDREVFGDFLQKNYNDLAEDGLSKLRNKAFEAVVERGLPTTKEEVFQYVPLRKLYANTWTMSNDLTINKNNVAEHFLPECDAHIVFVNGCFNPELSNLSTLPQKIVVCELTEAAKLFGSILNSHFLRMLKEEKDPFVLINASLMKSGAFVYLPPKTAVEKPVHLLNIITDPLNVFMNPRLQLFAANHSQLQMISTQVDLRSNKEQPYFNNAVLDMALEDEARIDYTQLTTDIAANAWHFEAMRAYLKRGSDLKTIAVSNGAQTVRNDYRIVLAAEGCAVHLNGLSMLGGKNETHMHILVDHQAPHCQSNQLFKSVLKDFSRSSFEGKIYVRQEAQKTDAFQLNKNLLISERAQARSKPNLEIFADDVKASHGATVGQLDQEQLFYLRTRGLSEKEAKNLLIFGYCEEMIQMVPLLSLREMITEKVLAFAST